MTEHAAVVTEPVDSYRADKDVNVLVDAQVIRLDAARLSDAMIVLPELLKTKSMMADTYRADIEAVKSLLEQ